MVGLAVILDSMGVEVPAVTVVLVVLPTSGLSTTPTPIPRAIVKLVPSLVPCLEDRLGRPVVVV